MPFPPSINQYFVAIRSRKVMSERGRKYRPNAIKAIKSQGLYEENLSGRLKVVIDFHPPTLNRRDIDNYTKAPLDALTHAGFWKDDEQIDELIIRRKNKVKGGKLKVYVEVLDE